MNAPDGWAEVEGEVAEFEASLREAGVSGELRAELSDRFRELAVLGSGDSAHRLRVLGLAVELLPFLEAEMRAIGHEEFADDVARLTVALSLWLELPAGLAVFAGHPCSQNESEERKHDQPTDRYRTDESVKWTARSPRYRGASRGSTVDKSWRWWAPATAISSAR